MSELVQPKIIQMTPLLVPSAGAMGGASLGIHIYGLGEDGKVYIYMKKELRWDLI